MSRDGGSVSTTTGGGSLLGNSQKKRIIFMGLKRSGKSSIINVVLYKTPPNETVFLPTTLAIKIHWLYTFRNYEIWDIPGHIDFLAEGYDLESIFGPAGSMIWILDAQDEYLDSINRLTEAILYLQQYHPDVRISIFVHKVDSLSSDYREDTVRDITQRIMDDLNDAGLENPPIKFYSTSVYDDSIYEAMSKVVQVLNPHLGTFETMLTTIAVSCKMQKLYLFDVMSKLYIASDTSPIDMTGYTLCSDFIDTIVDISEIYGWDRKAVTKGREEQDEEPVESEGNGAESFITGVRGTCLYLKEMNKYLALIGFSREPRFAVEKPLIDYNVQVFQEALTKVLAIT